MHGQIWTINRAKIDDKERQTGGQLARWAKVKQCAGSMNECRWMRAPISDDRGEFHCLAFVWEIMREMGGFRNSTLEHAAVDEWNRWVSRENHSAPNGGVEKTTAVYEQ